MNKIEYNIRKRSLSRAIKWLGVSFFTLYAPFFVSCSEWNDHYEGNGLEQVDQTLWQQLKGNSQLSDFCQVLQETKVFRMHKKTPVSYADLLNSGQSFTVVAPVNGTFNKDSLLQLVQTAQGDSVVERYFVHNHLSRSLNSTGVDAKTMLLLNKKHVTMEEGSIEGVNLTNSNIRAKNGILHVATRPLPYQRSLYETLSDIPELSSIGKVLRQYEEDYFDANSSVSSGIIEGVPVYVDSVVIERNRMLQQIGLINAEDSTYWMVAPTTESWQKAWDEAKKYFKYDQKVLKRDSIEQHWTTRALLDDAIFNITDQRTLVDSLVSVQYLANRTSSTNGKPVYHVFQKPFEYGGILYGTERIECSNGVLFKSQEWPFTPEQTYLRELWSEAEQTFLITNELECSYNTRRIAADSISEGGYLQIVPSRATSNWELTFRVNNTLSGKYDICAVILPKNVVDKTIVDTKPCKFKSVINYVDTMGVEKTFNCNNTQFQNDPERVDTIVLAEAFEFPACNYNQNDIKVSVKIQCSILARETSRYSREMYLDCIYLRPRRTIEN
ncbi:MAG: fasciclin domain-containing protein [Prevotella sp.]|nr:fasciclin domain-containing protein [Prevotella sp.]